MTETATNTDRARMQHRQGQALLRTHQWQAAAQILRAAAAADPSPEIFSDLARAYLQCGRSDAAQDALRCALDRFPRAQAPRNALARLLAAQNRIADALRLLDAVPEAERTPDSRIARGLTLYKAGRRPDAIASLEAARKDLPGDLPVRHMLARCYNEEKRWADALACLADAERICAEAPEQTRMARLGAQHFALKGLAAQHMQTSDTQAADAAIAAYETALRIDPKNDGADEMLGRLYAGRFQPEPALRHFERVSARHPQNARLHDETAQVLIMLQRYDAAIARLRTALECDPGHFPAARHLGEALAAAGRRDDAEMQFARLQQQYPERAEAWMAAGDACLITGRREAAAEKYRKALSLDPHIAELYRRLTDIDKTTCTDDAFAAQIAAECDRPGLDDAQKADLHMALASIRDRQGRHADAFGQLEEANACKRRTVRYDEAATRSFMTHMRTAFPAEAFVRTTPDLPRTAGPRPVFVVGLPRSGTSLIEQILASHTAVHGAGERPEFILLARTRLPADPADWASQPPEAMHRLGTAYLDALSPLAPGAACIVDKMPGNGVYAGLIRLALPDAKIVWVERDAMDCCFSCYRQIFAGNLPYAYEQGELGRYARTFLDLMMHWENVLPGDGFLHLRYEDLLAEPEAAMRRLIAFCGLDWQPQCLHFERTERAVHTASAAQVRRPLDKTTGGRWKPYAEGLTRLSDALNGRDGLGASREAEAMRAANAPRAK